MTRSLHLNDIVLASILHVFEHIHIVNIRIESNILYSQTKQHPDDRSINPYT